MGYFCAVWIQITNNKNNLTANLLRTAKNNKSRTNFRIKLRIKLRILPLIPWTPN